MMRIGTAVARLAAWVTMLAMPLAAWHLARTAWGVWESWPALWSVEDAVGLAAAAVGAAVAAYLSLTGLAMLAGAAWRGGAAIPRRIAALAPGSWQRVASVALGVGLSSGLAGPALAAVEPPSPGWVEPAATASAEPVPPAGAAGGAGAWDAPADSQTPAPTEAPSLGWGAAASPITADAARALAVDGLREPTLSPDANDASLGWEGADASETLDGDAPDAPGAPDASASPSSASPGDTAPTPPPTGTSGPTLTSPGDPTRATAAGVDARVGAGADAGAPADRGAATAPDSERRLTDRPAHAYVVQPGDSLWDITSALLGDDASDAEIAAAWPALYELNAQAIGDNPSLIHPGVELVVPEALAR